MISLRALAASLGFHTVLVNCVDGRDAPQSKFDSKIRIDDILEVAAINDDVGYNALEVWGGAANQSSIRYKGENHWTNLRRLKKAAPKTPLMMLLRGPYLVSLAQQPDDVVEAFIRHAAKNGINIFRVFDALNDPRNLEVCIRTIKKLQAEGNKDVQAQGTISYTISPVHTVEGYVQYARELQAMGCDSICIKDMAGLLTPSAARELITALKREIQLPITLHMHAGMGQVDATIPAAIKAGVDVVDVANDGISGGSGHLGTQTLKGILKTMGLGKKFPNLNERALEKARQVLFAMLPKYAAHEAAYDQETVDLAHAAQIPGGMVTSFRRDIIKEVESRKLNFKHEDVLKMVLAEIPRVRQETGWPPLVTPTSQFVGVQAFNNVMSVLQAKQLCVEEGQEFSKKDEEKARYSLVSPDIKKMVMGYLGKTPDEPSADLIAKFEAEGMTRIFHRPAADLPPGLPVAIRYLKAAGLLPETATEAEIYANDNNLEKVLDVAMFVYDGLDFWKHENNPEKTKQYQKPPSLRGYFQERASLNTMTPEQFASFQYAAANAEELIRDALEMTRLRHGHYKGFEENESVLQERAERIADRSLSFGDRIAAAMRENHYDDNTIRFLFLKIPGMQSFNETVEERCRALGVDEDLIPRIEVDETGARLALKVVVPGLKREEAGLKRLLVEKPVAEAA